MTDWKIVLRKEGAAKHSIPKSFREDMRVPGIVFAGESIFNSLMGDEAPLQVVNVATLPGIVGWSIAMPDIHYGYGFPIGGVAAMDVDAGVISPGGVGFDINCGVRMLRTDIPRGDAVAKARELCERLFARVPCGMGQDGDIRLNEKDMERVLTRGAQWAVANGHGEEGDVERCEQRGHLETNDVGAVSRRAKERGRGQLGTLGSGNHFVEVQEVEAIYDERAAAAMGLEHGLVTIMIHSGSRGLGAQVCQDYIGLMKRAACKYGISLPDGQLACAPVKSAEGEQYFNAMAAAANYAWANRQCIANHVRLAFEDVFGLGAARLGIRQVYDVAHNIAKLETHVFEGKKRELCVHRKGATRAFPAGHPDLPLEYRAVGQPALVPGDMGRCSFVMVGTQRAMEESWGSICHGAGRLKSRTAAKAALSSNAVIEQLRERGVELRAKDRKTIAEEAPGAYKNVEDVVESCVMAGLATKVARLKPIAVIKG